MFDLETEVHRWCTKVTPGLFFRGGRIAELEDHVHCAIAGLVEHGASKQDAFESAIKELGEVHSLRQEFHKNNNIVTNVLWRIGRHPDAKVRNVAAVVCVCAAIPLGVLLTEAFADWTKSSIASLCNIPLKWLYGLL